MSGIISSLTLISLVIKEEFNDIGLNKYPGKVFSSPAFLEIKNYNKDIKNYNIFNNNENDNILSGINRKKNDGNNNIKLLFNKINNII